MGSIFAKESDNQTLVTATSTGVDPRGNVDKAKGKAIEETGTASETTNGYKETLGLMDITEAITNFKGVVTNYSSVPQESKSEAIKTAVKARRLYRLEHGLLTRSRKNRKIKAQEWSSNLNKKELMMFGELEENEANHLDDSSHLFLPSFEHRVRKRHAHLLSDKSGKLQEIVQKVKDKRCVDFWPKEFEHDVREEQHKMFTYEGPSLVEMNDAFKL